MDLFYLTILTIIFFLGVRNYNKNRQDSDDDDDDDDDDYNDDQYNKQSSIRQSRGRGRSVTRNQNKKQMSTPEQIDVELKVLCLDRSGSMDTFGNEIKEGVDSYLQEVCRKNKSVKWSTITFDDVIETPVAHERLTKASRLKSQWVSPRGATALRDGILSAVELAQSMQDNVSGNKTSQVEIVIFTDGQENASSRISQQELSELIKQHKRKGWIFTFLAANQDAVASGHNYGFDAGRSMTSSAGRQISTWKRAASKKKFTKKCRAKAVSKKDRHYLNF
jgi:hypothetical protein